MLLGSKTCAIDLAHKIQRQMIVQRRSMRHCTPSSSLTARLNNICEVDIVPLAIHAIWESHIQHTTNETTVNDTSRHLIKTLRVWHAIEQLEYSKHLAMVRDLRQLQCYIFKTFDLALLSHRLSYLINTAQSSLGCAVLI